MSLEHSVLVGHANGDVHFLQVMATEQASQVAVEEAKQIGQLTNAGFRTVVAALWSRQETKTAGFLYAAAWNENAIDVLLHFGDRMANSHELYRSCDAEHRGGLTSEQLLRYCRQLKLD